MDDLIVKVSARSDVGMHRSGNEDSFLIADLTTRNVVAAEDSSTYAIGERGSVLMVSDGMGGAAAGELASQMAVSAISEKLMEEEDGAEIGAKLRAAAETANRRIWNHSQENEELSGMGATLTAALVQGTSAYVAQVGDSRAYLIRGDRIKQLTKDQSLAQLLVDAGEINEEQMASVPQNVIMQALGTQPDVKVAMSAIQLYRDDCLILCSDGLSNKIQPGELAEAVQETEDLAEACRALIGKANERGGEDNITVVIARFDGQALQSASDGRSITASFSAINTAYSLEEASMVADQYNAEASSERVTPLASTVYSEPTTNYQTQEAISVSQQETPVNAEQIRNRDFEEDTELSRARMRKSYAIITIAALASMILLLATAYFFYAYFAKSRPQPYIEQQDSATPSG